jgi:O-antigen ligase
MINVFHKMDISRATRTLLYVLIFFQPFNHFNSFREISFYGVFLLLLIKLVRGGIKDIGLNDRTVTAICLLVGWSLLVSITGPYAGESLNAIRKNLFKETVIFLAVISEYKSLRELRPLFWTVVLSFAVVTCGSIVENLIKGVGTINTMASDTWRQISDYFFARYPNNATFYLPFTALWLVSIKEPARKRWIGIVTCIAGLALVFIYNARTPLIGIPLAIFLIVLLAKRYRLVLVFLIATVLSVSILFTSKDADLSKYRSLADPRTYISDEGLTNRLGLWQVVIEFIQERPLTGYGYGWKKLAWLVQEKDSEEYWAERLPSARSYYVLDAKLEYGRVNPHNLPLQIIFEIGIVGFILFLWLWATVILKIIKTVRTAAAPETKTFMLSSFGLVLSYILINITNGFWQEAYGNMIFLFMASVYVIHRETVSVNRS